MKPGNEKLFCWTRDNCGFYCELTESAGLYRWEFWEAIGTPECFSTLFRKGKAKRGTRDRNKALEALKDALMQAQKEAEKV